MFKIMALLLAAAAVFSASGRAGATNLNSTPIVERYEQDGWTFFIRRATVLPLPETSPGQQAEEAGGLPNENPAILALDLVVLNGGQLASDIDAVRVRLLDTAGAEALLLTSADAWVEQGEDRNALDVKPVAAQDISRDISGRFYFALPNPIAKEFYLEVDPAGVCPLATFGLKISSEQLSRIMRWGAHPLPEEQDWEILTPEVGQTVYPGMVVPVVMRLAPSLPKPQTIILIAPDYIFEDRFANLTYEVTIEPSTPAGPYELLVIASWKDGKQDHTLSRLIRLNVLSAQHASNERHPVCSLSPRAREWRR